MLQTLYQFLNMGDDKIYSKAFTWIIQNYSMCNKKNGEHLQSPEFKEDKYGGKRCCLWIYPKGSSEKFHDSFGCYFGLKKDNMDDKEVPCDLKLECVSPNGEIIKTFSYSGVFKNGEGRGIISLLRIAELKDKLKKYTEDILTIRCFTSLLKNPIEAKTEIGFNKFSFKWFVEAPHDTDWSDSCKIPVFDRNHIQVSLVAVENDILIKIKKSIYIIPQVVKCKISLVDDKGIVRNSKTDEYFFDSACDNETWKFPSFFTKDHLNSKHTNFLKNGYFTLMLNFSISNGYDYEELESEIQYKKFNLTYDVKPSHVLLSLQDELKNEFTSKSLADVDIKLGEEVFKAHKVILAAQSAFFKELIHQNIEKENRFEICITDVDTDTMKLLLNFIYTGELEGKMNYQTILNLLVAASKYKINTLSERCCYHLTTKISDQNVCEILDTADIIENTFLKTIAYNYMVENAKTILSSREWTELATKNPKLALEIIPKLVK